MILGFLKKNGKPWAASDGLVVVVVPQVCRLAGPGVGEEADVHVGLPKGVRPHQGDHFAARHGEGVSEELDGRATIDDGRGMMLCLGCLVPKL